MYRASYTAKVRQITSNMGYVADGFIVYHFCLVRISHSIIPIASLLCEGKNKGVKNGYYNFLPMQEKFCFKVSLFNKVAPPYTKARQVLSARRNTPPNRLIFRGKNL